MWRQTVCVCAVLTGICSYAASATAQILLDFNGNEQRNIQSLVEAAGTRLVRCDCQKVLSDFVDENGVSLATRLAASNRNALEAFRSLRFVNRPFARQCRDGSRLAFTVPGSQAIHLCTLRLRNESVRKSVRTEVIMIHEFLHSLGLGENPPSSREITDRVTARCGDS